MSFDAIKLDNYVRGGRFGRKSRTPETGRLVMVLVVDIGPSIRCTTKDRCRA